MATSDTKKRFGWKKWLFLAILISVSAYAVSPELMLPALKLSLSIFAAIALAYFGYRTAKDSFFAPLPNQAAVIYRWGFGDKEGTRTGKVFYEKDVLPFIKLCVKLPFIEKAKFYELKVRSVSFGTSFMAKDDTGLTLPATLFFTPDFNVLNASGIPIYGTTTDKEIETQTTAVGNEKISAIGGSHKSEAFLRKLPTIAQILNEAFRLPRLAHVDHDPATCGVTGCKFPVGTNIGVDKLDKFHETHWHWVNEALKNESSHVNERSKLEEMNGIDVREVRVSSPELSEDSKKARERKREYTDLEKALTHKVDALKNVGSIPGATFQGAADVVAETFHPKTTTRQVISFEGDPGSLLGLVAAAKAVASPSPAPVPTTDDAGKADKRKGGRK